jgi:uncharacterized protein YjbI with pentapeptide repeats
MATKMIKFDLQMKGIKVTSLEELQENFSADILPIFQTGRLTKWLMSRELVAQSEAIAAIDKNSTELQQLAAICRVLELDDDEEVLQFLLEDRQAVQTAQVAASTPAVEASDVDTHDAAAPSFSGVDWSGQNMSGRQFVREDLRNANLKNTNFSGSDLSQANLTGANLNGANLSSAKFNYANFSDANLSCANLNNSELAHAIFMGANLTKASLVNAQLFNANLTKADLSFADLNGACFFNKNPTGSLLAQAMAVRYEQLNITDTKLTGVVGFKRPENS